MWLIMFSWCFKALQDLCGESPVNHTLLQCENASDWFSSPPQSLPSPPFPFFCLLWLCFSPGKFKDQTWDCHKGVFSGRSECDGTRLNLTSSFSLLPFRKIIEGNKRSGCFSRESPHTISPSGHWSRTRHCCLLHSDSVLSRSTRWSHTLLLCRDSVCHAGSWNKRVSSDRTILISFSRLCPFSHYTLHWVERV